MLVLHYYFLGVKQMWNCFVVVAARWKVLFFFNWNIGNSEMILIVLKIIKPNNLIRGFGTAHRDYYGVQLLHVNETSLNHNCVRVLFATFAELMTRNFLTIKMVNCYVSLLLTDCVKSSVVNSFSNPILVLLFLCCRKS